MPDRKYSTTGPGHSHHTDKSTRSSLSGSSGGQQGSSQSHSQTHSQSITSTTRRRHRNEASRRGQQVLDRDKNAETITKVLDPDTKEDRTPQSLSLRGPAKGGKDRSGKRNESGVVSPSVSQFSEERSFSRMESTESGSTTPKSVSLSLSEGEEVMEPFTLEESLETSSMDSSRQATSEQDSRRNRRDRDRDERDDDGEREATQTQSSEERSQHAREMTREERLRWLQAPCSVTLTETPTFFVMERPDEQIGTEGEEANAIIQRNEVYKTCCDQREANKYIERGMQTFNNPMKNKETQFNLPTMVRTGVGVTTWEIHDTMRKLEEEETDSDAPDLHPKPTITEMDDEAVEVDDETTAMLDGDTGEGGGADDTEGKSSSTVPKSKRSAWLLSPALPHCLMIVERMVVQNVWQKEQLAYRSIDADEFADKNDNSEIYDTVSSPAASRKSFAVEKDENEEAATNSMETTAHNSKSDGSLMQVLWQYTTPTIKDKNVSCLSWNKHNHDILAVGYGDYGISASTLSQRGFVCCWSIKNPVFPERTIRIDNAGVSAVDFSHVHPSLLAVGHTDGTLALFDIRKQSNTPALKSTVGGQHTGTVWEVKWVEKGKDRGESLTSISADGRVTDWSIKKGLECTNLIRLKRVPNKQQGITEVRGDALLSRQSGGMCVDFNTSERMIYIVGTEDGTIHKCSTSYNEQYLQDYAGHAGPVYRCRWSPFCSDIFLTCSADWTAKMWNQARVEPVLTFQSVADAVHDVTWSPRVSTIFGAITATGRIDIWDLVDPLEPKTYLELEGRSLNCLAFANQNSAVVVTGDNKGAVTVIKLKGPQFESPDGPEGTPEHQEEKLLKYLRKNTQ